MSGAKFEVRVLMLLFNIDLNFSFSEFSVPICLNQKKDFEKTRVTILGYGKTSFQGFESKGLQIAFLKTMTNKDCETYYEDDDIELVDSQICANDPEKQGRDTW